jgi:hypothetical protein
LLLWLSATTSSLAAEGDGGTGTSGKTRAVKPALAGSALAQRFCDALHTLPQARKAKCCATSATGSLAGECVRALGDSLRDHTVTLDPADVERCWADSSRELEGCDWVTPLLPRAPENCRGIVHGRLEAGKRCRSSIECNDGLVCRATDAAGKTVCAPPGGAGASCVGAPDEIATYTRQADSDARHPECSGFCFKGRCTALVPPGGACSSSKQCARGSHCASGRCVEGPGPKLGESCEGTTCEGDLRCVDGKCSPLKKAGEPCTRPFECEAACIFPKDSEAGTCGMKCSSWPPGDYTPPRYDSPQPAQTTPAPPK